MEGQLQPVLFVLQPDEDRTALGHEMVPYDSTTIDRGCHDDTPEGIVAAAGLMLNRMSTVLRNKPVDILLTLGDRYEMLIAALSAVPFRIPIAHIHGGEETVGAIDNQCRHALTKLAHIHFVATETAYSRLVQMGEDDWNIYWVGSPAIDNLREIGGEGWIKESKHILMTYHPETLSPLSPEHQIDAVLEALDLFNWPVLITMPNQDVGNQAIRQRCQSFRIAGGYSSRKHPVVNITNTLGPEAYFQAMREAVAMVGNSSSGIIEAEYLGLPVVNVGDRQKGREHGPNVINVPCETTAIVAGIRTAISMSPLPRGQSVYMHGDHRTAPRIVRVLKGIELGNDLIRKQWFGV